MDGWFVVSALIIGVMIGSFLCLVITRFPHCTHGHCWLQRLRWPYACCEHCGYQLKFLDMIPLINWLWQREHCHYCQKEFGYYPYFIEIISILLLVTLAMICPQLDRFIWLLLFSYAALLLSEIDRRHLLLPNAITFPLLWSGLIFNLCLSPQHLQQAVTGAIWGYLSFWLLSKIYRLLRQHDGLGHGDIKYFAAIGAWTGLPALPVVATLSAGIGTIIWMCNLRQQQKTAQYPFGPCLSIAGWLVLILQHSKNEGLTNLFYL